MVLVIGRGKSRGILECRHGRVEHCGIPRAFVFSQSAGSLDDEPFQKLAADVIWNSLWRMMPKHLEEVEC